MFCSHIKTAAATDALSDSAFSEMGIYTLPVQTLEISASMPWPSFPITKMSLFKTPISLNASVAAAVFMWEQNTL